MKYLILFFTLSVGLSSNAQKEHFDSIYPAASYVDFDRFLGLAQEVRDHRAARLISLDEFNQMSHEPNTIILDTRSKEMYDAKHIKGAIHLEFSNFTQVNLAEIIPDTNTRILIYCNNNFADDEIYFASKAYVPDPDDLILGGLEHGPKEFPLTMALNVPTYINLYGYGYKNVYELNDLVSVFYRGIEFEGSSID